MRQLAGAAVGIIVFMVAAKVDAERWNKWAWPLMGISIFLLLLIVLPFTESIAPRVHGSRRFLFRTAIDMLIVAAVSTLGNLPLRRRSIPER